MKKGIKVIMLTLLSLMCVSLTVFASNADTENFNWNEAEKTGSRYERSGEEFYIVDTYEYTEAIESNRNTYNLDVEKNYKKTICEIWTLRDEYSLNRINSEPNDGWDDTGSVHFYTTIYYTDITRNGIDYRKMNSVSGRYAILDSQVSVVSHAVFAFQRGAPLNSGEPTYTEQIAYYPNSQTWSWTLPSSSFPYLQKGTEITYQAVRYEYVLQRGTSSRWEGGLITTV